MLRKLADNCRWYLIHAPYGGRDARLGTWRALVEAQKVGKIRSLGVSNYGIHHLEELQSYISEQESQHGKCSSGEISVGQWEIHPWLLRTDIVEWCQKRGVVIEAYSPVVQGTRWGEKSLQKLQAKRGKTGAQILLRWSLQKVLNLQHRILKMLIYCLQRALYHYRNQ